MNIFKLILALRPINLFLTVLILVSVRYGILIHESIDENWFPFYAVSLVFVMCFGYLINDYFDVETDRINKPGKNVFSTAPAFDAKLFLWASISIAILIPIAGFLRNYHWANLLLIYLFSTASLFIYAKYLKNSLFFGNLLIAILAGLSIIVPAYIKPAGTYLSSHSFVLISIYSLFALLSTLVREIVKDAEDAKGDKQSNIRTIATVLGIQKSVYFSSVFMFILIILLIGTSYYFYSLENNWIKALAFLSLALAGLVPFIQLIRAKDKIHFSRTSMALKTWMFLGIITMWI